MSGVEFRGGEGVSGLGIVVQDVSITDMMSHKHLPGKVLYTVVQNVHTCSIQSRQTSTAPIDHTCHTAHGAVIKVLYRTIIRAVYSTVIKAPYSTV